MLNNQEETKIEHDTSINLQSFDNKVLELEQTILDKKYQRNKSFSKIMENRQNIRARLKNSLFNQKTTPNITEQNPNVIVEVNEEGEKSKNKERKIQQVFTRFIQKTHSCEREADAKNNIFYIDGNFEQYYNEGEVLGEGCVGLVKKATRYIDGKIFAVKIVRTRDEETIQNIKNEFLHIKLLDHPNIVKVYELYIDNIKGKIYSVMELIEGQEMFEVINKLGHYSEDVAKKIFRQIIDVIEYMHQRLVCHRDLKPNNILCNQDGTQVKITDFNVSKFSESYKDYKDPQKFQSSSIRMWTYTGTIAFSAPEIFKGQSYDEAIDMWSAGCILYTMLFGQQPFQAEYVEDLIKLILKGQIQFPEQTSRMVSPQAKDLILACLNVNPLMRIKPHEALNHEWLQMQNQAEPIQSLSREILAKNLSRLIKKKDDFTMNRKRATTIGIVCTIEQFVFSSNCFDNVLDNSAEEAHVLQFKKWVRTKSEVFEVTKARKKKKKPAVINYLKFLENKQACSETLIEYKNKQY